MNKEREVLDIFNRAADIGDLVAYPSKYGKEIIIGIVQRIKMTPKTHTVTISNNNFQGNNFIILKRANGDTYFMADSINGLHTDEDDEDIVVDYNNYHEELKAEL